MKKMFFCAAVVLMTVLTLCGADLSVAGNGKSAYSIAWYDQGSPNLQREYLNVANLMQRVIEKRTGVRLPKVKMSALPKGAKAIFIGAAAKPGQWKLNEYAIEVDKAGNIHLTGDDFDAVPTTRRGEHQLRMGSVKAALEFLKKFAGADFLYPGFEGIYIPENNSLNVPENFHFKAIPYLQFGVGRSVEQYYGLANGKMPSPWYTCHGGHSHIPAIPPAKYLKTHLEYFAIVRGKRNGYPGIPQYCLSNPEVRELIYQKILKDVDQPGVIETQLAHTDGFRKCECPDCKKLLGDDAGEAVWKLHLDMADRLLKDRPGKRVRIMAYYPTQNPPKYRKVFPKNTSVTIAVGRNLTPEYFAKWKDYTVPGGFDVYLYNWGEYQTEGLTPTFNLKKARQQADLLRKNNINAFYLCGFMELPGLCCPVNTYYLRAMSGDQTSPEAFLKDYCFKAFGAKAGAEMVKFYTLLYSRVDISPSSESDYTMTKKAAEKSVFAPNVAILHKRYPEEIQAELETYLKKAENAAPGNFMLKRTRREFDYLKLTAGACNDFYAYHANPGQKTFEKLAHRVIDRKKFIEALPKLPNNRLCDRTHLPVFGYLEPQMLMTNGRLGGKLAAPFFWEMEYYLVHNMRPSGRLLKADGKDFQQMIGIYGEPTVKEILAFPAFVGCRYDDSNFYAIFRFPKAKTQVVNYNCYLKFQRNENSPCYKLWRSGGNGLLYCVERTKTSAENKGNEEVWKYIDRNLQKKYPAKLVWSPFDASRGAEAVMTVPWGLLGGKPKAGERAKINFFFWPKQTAYCWEYNINLLNWHHRFNGIGTVEF